MLLVPAAAGEVVDDGDLVAAGREPQGRRPAQVAVAPENENAHEARQGSVTARDRTGRGAEHAPRRMSERPDRAQRRPGRPRRARRDPAARARAAGRLRLGRAEPQVSTRAPTRGSPRTSSEGEGFTQRATTPRPQPASNYSPGLPLLVAGLYERHRRGRRELARIVLALLGSLAVLFAYLIGRRLAGPGRGADRRRRRSPSTRPCSSTRGC